jgi:quinohemoprotein ethanol dehydrogenase
MTHRRFKSLVIVVILATILYPYQAWSQGAKKPGTVTAGRLATAEKGTGETGNWLSHGRTSSEQRYSTLSQINESNVSQLGLAWSFKLDVDRGTEASPLIDNGVMFTTGAYSIVYALDAKTGKLLWKYDPQVPRVYAAKACCDAVNRGVALWEGRVYVGTLDGYLVALDAASGKVAWKIDTLITRSRAYTITGAPRIADGRIVIGNGGAEFGVRGYVSSYDAKSGKLVWRFFTVPGDPSKPFESKALEMAAKTWSGDQWWVYGGGGTVWDSMAYDSDLKLLYIGVGNGSPWNRTYRSPGGGDNLFLSSIVALKADTGEYVWHYQTTPGDSFDYTATQHLILADLVIAGRTRQVILQAPKNGFFYVLDRRTGELLSAEKYVQVNWASRVDLKTGRPIEDTAVTDYSKEPKLLWPSPYGGHNWQPMAFHPGTKLVYIPAQELPFVMASDPKFTFTKLDNWNTATVAAGIPEDKLGVEGLLAVSGGKLLAWDPVNQRAVWSVDQKHPFNGGILATAGNLVFQGTADGHFVAYSADKGRALWDVDAQTGVIAPPVTFTVDGEQYVTVMAGWGGALGLVGGEVARAAGVRSISRVLTYKLGGKATLPPVTAEPEWPEPPPLTESADVVNTGRALYNQKCIFCHGAAVVGGGVIADLRRLDKDSHASFDQLVRGGSPSKGMPAFGDSITADELRAIHAYIIKRAQDAKKDRGTTSK